MAVALPFESEARRRLRQRLNRARRPAWLGTLRRTTPFSQCWGYDRGRPIDRYYIERFIMNHRRDIRGHVLEIKEALYTARYGGGVTKRDVLDKNAGNPHATIVADLEAADTVGSDTFDCCIVTQTLQYVFEVGAAVRELHRMLRAGGVLLARVPVITRLANDTRYEDYWRFTPDACARLFRGLFREEDILVEGHGNVLASIAFLEGLAQEELTQGELDVNDWLFPLVVTIRAVKQAGE